MQKRSWFLLFPGFMFVVAFGIGVLTASGALHASSSSKPAATAAEPAPEASPEAGLPETAQTIIDNISRNPAPPGPPAIQPPTAPASNSQTAQSTDAERMASLDRIAATLEAYRKRTGSYPSTSNNVQSACVYTALDQLCRFQADLGIETLSDPRGDRARYGYWYVSDGASYTLVASLEGAVPADHRCGVRDGVLANKTNLYCVSGHE